MMDAVLSYAWRQQPTTEGTSAQTPRRGQTRRHENTSSTETSFATPPQEATGKDTQRQFAAAALPMPIPALFSPLTSSDGPASSKNGAAVPVTPEGLRPRPTVYEMRRILNLHLGTPVPPPSRPPPSSWFNCTTSQDVVVSTPDANGGRYALVGHCSNVVPLPPQCIAGTVSISSNNNLSLSALTYSPATNGAGWPQQKHQPRKGARQNTAAGEGAGAGFSSPPVSFGSPSFFPASVSRGVATTSPTMKSAAKGVASSPTLTTSGAKTAVGLLVAESLEVSQSYKADHAMATPVQAAEQFPTSNREFTGIAMSPNLTMSGAKTAVGLAIAESFDKDESIGSVIGAQSHSSSSNSLTKVGGIVFGDQTRSDGRESSDRIALLPPRDWDSEKEQMQPQQPRTIPHAPSDASSLYEEEGERLRQQMSRSAASSTMTTPRTNRSRSTDQTPSTAGRTWEHYQQYYEDEDDFDDTSKDDDESDIDASDDVCEYTALHRPMLELYGSVDVSRDISFSSRQGFLSGKERDHEGSTKGCAGAAYDFGRLEGIASKSVLASLDGSSIRPNPSVEGGPIVDSGSTDGNYVAIGNLPSSPPRIPLAAQQLIGALPLSPPSLPNGSQHEVDVLPRSPPTVPGDILCDEDIDARYQRPMEVPKEAINLPSFVFGLDPNVSALSHATGMMSALVGGEGDTNVGVLPKMEEAVDVASTQSGYTIDDALVKRKRQHQARASKENQLKEVVDQLRDASTIVRAICVSKGVLGEAATSIFSGYEENVRCSILNEFDSLLTFVFDDDHTRESIRFVQGLVKSAPEKLASPDSGEIPSTSALETPRNVPLTRKSESEPCWKANDDLLRALGIGGYSSPDAVVRGGDASLFTLPSNSTTPNMSNQSMATTITSEPNSSNAPSDKNEETSASRRLRFTAEAVVLLLQQITVAAYRLPEERIRDDSLWAASVEEIKRGYHYLSQISDADLGNLQAAFTLQERTPDQTNDDVIGPPALSRGGATTTSQLIESSKRLDLQSPEAARMIDGEINNPPHVVRAMATFEANSSPQPVVPTVSEEPEEDCCIDDNGFSGDQEGYNALESDAESNSVVTSEPRDLLTSFEDEIDDSNHIVNSSDLTPDSPTLHEVGDADDEQSQVGGSLIEESFLSTEGLRDQLGEDLRRLCFDTSAMHDHRDDGEGEGGSEREGPSEHYCLLEREEGEMSV